MICPCGTGKNFESCCEPFLNGDKNPETAEQLMRSRYTAYDQKNIKYIQSTLAAESRADFDLEETKKWAAHSKWKGLKVISTKKGGVEDTRGTVEFIATFEKDGEVIDHHEISQFKKDKTGKWYFVDGDAHTHAHGEGHHDHHHHHEPQKPITREDPKVGRNDPCPCGSGKKYKKCCGA